MSSYSDPVQNVNLVSFLSTAILSLTLLDKHSPAH